MAALSFPAGERSASEENPPSFSVFQVSEEERELVGTPHESSRRPSPTPRLPRFPPSLPLSTTPTSSKTSSRSGRDLGVLLLLLSTSTCASHILPHAALADLSMVSWLPVAQFGLMAIVSGIWRRAFSVPHDGRSILTLFGLVLAASKWMEIIVARQLDIRIWSAVELALLPIILILPASSPALPLPKIRLSLAVIATTFLTSFCLIGIPAPTLGLLAAFIKVWIDVFKLSLMIRIANGKSTLRGAQDSDGTFRRELQNGGECTSERLVSSKELRKSFLETLYGGCIIATGISLMSAIGINLLVQTPKMQPPSLPFLLSTTFSALSSSLYLFALSILPPLTTLSVLLPRNALLLTFLAFGVSFVGTSRPGQGLSLGPNNWLQMLLVLIGGSGVIFSMDESLREIGRDVREAVAMRVDSSGVTSDRVKLALNQGEEHEVLFSQGVREESGRKSEVIDRTPPREAAFILRLLPLLPFAFFLLQIHHHHSFGSISTATCSYLPFSLQSSLCPEETGLMPARTVDLVFAYFEEDLGIFKEHLSEMKHLEFVRERDVKVIVYNKGRKREEDIRNELGLSGRDEVYPLQNRGREGATYLQHILRHYNSSLLPTSENFPFFRPISAAPLADHTFFLQPHLAWDWIARPRLQLVGSSTGFAHFGPMMRSNCGEDGRGTGFYPIVRDLYQIFEGKLCPPTGQLTAWSAQFVVSKRRILKNPYERYFFTDEILEAPDGHWIHNIWGPQDSGGETAPAAGHSLERAWPIIFGCSDPRPADECPDDVHIREKCQCLDY